MDHLPVPSDPIRPALEVPYICNAAYTYDNLDFSSYPQRAGVDIEEWRRGDCKGKSLDEIAPFLQAWLFFGMLVEIFGIADIKVDIADFIAQRNGKTFVSTARLHKYMWYWVASEARPGWHMTSDHPPRTEACLKLVNSVVNDLGRIKLGTECEAHSPGNTVLLSIIIVAEQLDRARQAVFYLPQIQNFKWDLSEFGKSLLTNAGWCLGEIYMLNIDLVSVLFYISSFDRHILKKDHSACSSVLCVANQIDESIYQTKHVDGSCNCEHISAEGTGHYPITAILKEGGIPVISLAPPNKTSPIETVVVERAHHSKTYVAISHVWSDGMGNPRQNSLPICQFRRLQGMVDALYDPVARPVSFWVDTICVPLHPETRKAAIRRMAKTYEDSDKVLVLDASLRHISVDSPPDELLMRIRCTPWTQRLWTLQEGMLAKELYFQLLEGAIDPEPLYDIFGKRNTPVKLGIKYFGKPDFSLDDPLAVRIYRALASDMDEYITDEAGTEAAFQTLARFPDCPNMDDDTLLFRLGTNGECSSLHPIFFSGMFHYRRLRDRMPSVLGSVIRALVGRLSSRMEDETICLATLLDIDPGGVLGLPGRGHERMKTLLNSIDVFPPAIIFSDLQRIEEEGYRWAPTSFMTRGASHRSILQVGFGARLTIAGLQITNYFGYLFPDGVEIYATGSFLIQDPTVPYKTRISPRKWQDGRKVNEVIRRPAIILENTVKYPFSRGALVSVCTEEDGIFFVRYEVSVLVEQYNESSDETVHKVKGILSSQKWCLR